MWLVKRKTRQRVSSSTRHNGRRIMSTKVSMHIRKEVPPAASPSTLEGVEGGNQYVVHGFFRCA